MSALVEKVGEECLLIGEGPHWDAETQSLYYADAIGNKIHKYTPHNNQHTTAIVDYNIAMVIPVHGEENKFLITQATDLGVIEWFGSNTKITSYQKLTHAGSSINDEECRFSDGKCDTSGRLWIGSLGFNGKTNQLILNKGSLFSMTNGVLKTHYGPVSLSNGVSMNEALKKLYYVDSGGDGRVFQFDFDVESGEIKNQTTVFTLSKHGFQGMLDGQAVDTDGNIWLAVFNTNSIIKIDPRVPETLLETVQLPAKYVTSLTFGGTNLDEIYVTTCSMTLDGQQLTNSIDGALYKVTNTGSKGFPGNRVKL